MNESIPEKPTLLDAVRKVVAENGGERPTMKQLVEGSHIPEWGFIKYFPKATLRSALSAAGFEFGSYSTKVDLAKWLADWGQAVRAKGAVLTLEEYNSKKYGSSFAASVFERDPNGGQWSSVPTRFLEFAKGKATWEDVVALINAGPSKTRTLPRNPKLAGRPTYGTPIDFRGLRHEPVNEQGVVFLFGMVAKELGYMVEAVQVGFPDCDAKRQIEGGRWQRVRIEFEFQSRNYDHPKHGCDVIVCWRHDWPKCPKNIEVVELSTVIKSLAKSDD